MEDSTMYDSSLYDTTSSVGSTGDAGTAALMLGVIGFVAILAYVIGAIFMGMIFKKAGVPAWKAWVPVYNQWVFLELGGQKGWWVLLSLIPFVNFITVYVTLVFLCIAAYRIGLNFGKEAWFVVLYILVGPVWLIWLALDKTAVWQPATAGAAVAPTQPTASEGQSVVDQQSTQFGPASAPQAPTVPTQGSPDTDSTNNQQQPPTVM